MGVRVLRFCAASLIHQSLEGFGLVDGEIGEDLAVDLDPGLGSPLINRL